MKYSEIIKLNNELEGVISGSEYKIAILSNIMVHQLKEVFEFSLRTKSINAKVLLGGYDNIVQDSARFKNVNAIIFFWEVCNFIDGLQYKVESLSSQEFENIVQKIETEIDLVLNNLKDTPLVLINKFSSLIFDQFSLSNNRINQLTERLNAYLKEKCGVGVNIIDIDKVISKLSIESSIDLRYYYSSKTLYSIEFYKEYFNHIKPIFIAATGKAKKALIFDCDNTLWKGTLGEDGFDNIKIYQEIQYLALHLAKKGVIIGICSKNNPNDVNEVLKSHPDMILRDENIIIKKINWNDKVSNLRNIAQDLNIGLDSLVFVDDASFEVELVKKELVSVEVFQVPPREFEYGLMMRRIANLFYTPSRTEEDILKSKMYKDQIKRFDEKNKSTDMVDYLASLGISITVYTDNLSQLSRISQLTQKTNQFNLTTKRYSESDIKRFILDDDKIVISIEVNDKFGSSGLTGLAILCKKTSKIDTLLLSCRVIGRNIEYKFINIIVDIAKKNKLKTLKACYVKTHKNPQVEDFYDKCGFDVVNKVNNHSMYSLKMHYFKYKDIKYIKERDGR
jgi:FkbH-like protein